MSRGRARFAGARRRNAARPVGVEDTERSVSLLAARLPAALAPFAALAYDLAWLGRPEGPELFRAIDPYVWETSSHNPVRLLLEAPPAQLARAARDRKLVARAKALKRALELDRARPFENADSISAEHPVAFLCAEFAVHQSLPIYSGGLGVLAGDLLKEASDRGLPLVGIGLYYRQGCFHQRLDTTNWQQEFWIETLPHMLPLSLVTDARGAARTVTVPIRGRDVVFQIWRVAFGRTSLYLLDADRPENAPVDRWITARLYDSEPETRLAQYLALGVGGIRALRALGIDPAAVHLNEGHAAFAALELAGEGITAGRSPKEAIAAAREQLVFTTHTPVSAGNESYGDDELWAVAGHLVDRLGLDREHVLALGRIRPEDRGEPLGLTVLALRTSRRTNGVSRRHGEVSRGMWRGVWPDRALEDVPIGAVTNGVHLPSWMAPPMRALLARHLGPDWEERADDPMTWKGIDAIPDEEIWEVRNTLRAELVEFVRQHSVLDRLGRPDAPRYIEAAARAFEPDVLTVCWARRIAEYKRLQLLIHDSERARDLVRGKRPLQYLVAGKAHPRDDYAKRILQDVSRMRYLEGVTERAEILLDHDLNIAKQLVSGCDVWINVPRPPLEASGTSGMKAMLNGGLNLSVLDGWWAEAWDGSNGWAIPAEPELDDESRDARDSAVYFDLMEREIIPSFYERDASRIPRGWIRRIKASLRTNGPRFCMSRVLADYVRTVYPSD